ncbi:alpha/beta hydrolase, partial [Hansschlegelia beijingensis]|uniref:alpha/beta hydrolase n=1 Tax=Hansschlegelia beijingensis TaxID=1133344 RepID=UPI00387F2997
PRGQRPALLRPMSPLAAAPAADLSGTPVLMLSGSFDPIVPDDDVGRLAGTLRAAGADVDHRTLPAGHGLSQADIAATAEWLARF